MEISAVDAARSCSDSSSSPEFEFWMVGNNRSSPQPHLLTADELFVDGVVLPLHLLSLPGQQPGLHFEPEPEPAPEPAAAPSAAIFSADPSSTGSRRWKDIFKAGEKKRKDINIWPFSRSRSAGNDTAGEPPQSAALAGRNVSSAPCSRSNSRGESYKPASARRWAAASPSRAGLSGRVHLNRTSPVWQLRRPPKCGDPDKVGPKEENGGGRKGIGGGGARVLSLNVQTCIGYRSQRSCGGDDDDRVAGDVVSSGGDGGDGNGSLFSFRTLFSKKVY